MKLRFALFAGLLVSAAAIANSAVAGDVVATAGATCKNGTVAMVAGQRVCLRAGAQCRRALDRQYHAHGFHCHNGKLTRAKATPSAPTPTEPEATPQTPPLPPGATGRQIDVGGYKLYLECEGSGSPTVVMERGYGLSGTAASPNPTGSAWLGVRSALANETRVCSYDRAGLGHSDRRPTNVAPTGARFADELHTLLTNAGVPGPYVLTADSFAGLLAGMHVIRYPQDYVGLVFVDALYPGCTSVCPFEGAESAVFDASLATVQFGSRPMVMLTAGIGSVSDPDGFLSRSTNSIWASVPGADHVIARTNADLVAEATRVVLAAVRSGASLPACAATRLESLGGKCERR
jgi:pimeloyl-ACP methyl ester carboxylesterase